MLDKTKETGIKNIKRGFTQHHFYMHGTGFTLIEIIFVLAIISSVMVAVFSLVQRTTGFLPGSGNKLIASYLAQEGVEIVRNLRDNNRFIVPTVPWNDGLTACAAGCEADFASQSLTPWSGQYLKHDGNFYNYGLGDNSKFQRKIIITSESDDVLVIDVQIFWDDKGVAKTISAVEKLYQW